MSEQTETNCRILLSGGSGQIEEKKSVFIANIARADSEEEATAFIETMKKKYWDARHNCSAFVIGERGELTRCSDDGEPSGTAGRPMLEVLLRENIKNIVVVVTRYFGGTLLGTGGLVRAYTQAVKEGLNDCKIGVLRMGVPLALTTDYNGIGKILYLLSAMGLAPKDSDYGEKVTLQVLVPVEEKDRLVRDITEATAGKTEILQENPISYVDNES
ncbi:MAG: YigZ family protein [Bacteroides sp.]